MPSLLLIIFLFQLIIHVLNTAGVGAINEFLWSLYTQTSLSSHAGRFAKATVLRKELLRLRKEIAATSAQDDFARWAKLGRQRDKAEKEYNDISASLQTTRSAFDSRVNTARIVVINVSRLYLQWSYSKDAMFWIPQGWLPYYAEWILSWPRAPLGSVSVQTWSLACGSVIALCSEAILASLALMMEGVRSRRMERVKRKVGDAKKAS